MGTLLLSTICATLLLSSSPALSPADTAVVYVIDGKKIENFNGTQLVGKTIASYNIETTSVRGYVLKMHLISTATPALLQAGTTVKGVSAKGVKYMLDNKEISQEDFRKLNMSDIQSINVLKSESEGYLIMIVTKSRSRELQELQKQKALKEAEINLRR